jgi:ribonucleotide monophosphatase NagD (HAD superfamily)
MMHTPTPPPALLRGVFCVAVDYRALLVNLGGADDESTHPPVDPAAVAAIRVMRTRSLAMVLTVSTSSAADPLAWRTERARLLAAGLGDFYAVVRAHEVGVDKPDPGFYSAVLDHGYPPRDVLWVGPRPEEDVAGPLRIGMRAALVAPGGRLPKGYRLPDKAITVWHVQQLPDLLRPPR